MCVLLTTLLATIAQILGELIPSVYLSEHEEWRQIICPKEQKNKVNDDNVNVYECNCLYRMMYLV